MTTYYSYSWYGYLYPVSILVLIAAVLYAILELRSTIFHIIIMSLIVAAAMEQSKGDLTAIAVIPIIFIAFFFVLFNAGSEDASQPLYDNADIQTLFISLIGLYFFRSFLHLWLIAAIGLFIGFAGSILVIKESLIGIKVPVVKYSLFICGFLLIIETGIVLVSLLLKMKIIT